MEANAPQRVFDVVAYRNKRYTVPRLDPGEGVTRIAPRDGAALHLPPRDEPVVRDLGAVFDVARFLDARRPVSVGGLAAEERARFVAPSDARNVLDLPIKFPGSDFRLPNEFAQWAPVVQRVADAEWALHRRCYDEYYCYLTVRRERVAAGAQGHYAPCHVDGFQGARWAPKVRANHSYTVTNALPTMYFPQPFDLRPLDLARHDAFWEMNRQVAMTNAVHGWNDYPDFELMLMDAYSVHIAIDAPREVDRTWLRLSFEVRPFDRLGNAHNPFFDYDWEMVPRDIEQLGLVAFDPTCDPTLRVFPWQAPDGTPNPPGVYTAPNLRPWGAT